jgi:hypothetical protein
VAGTTSVRISQSTKDFSLFRNIHTFSGGTTSRVLILGIKRPQRESNYLSPFKAEVEEYRQRVFENEVLRRIFGPKMDEVTGEWRRLHNKEFYALYSSPSIIRVIKSRRLRWAGHVARMGERRGAYRDLVGKPEGSRPLGKPRRSWEDNIKMDLREVGWGAWTGSIWLRIGTGDGLL